MTFVAVDSMSENCHFCEQPITSGLKIESDNRAFCCNGCAMADAMLNNRQAVGPGQKLLQRYAHLVVAGAQESLQVYNADQASWKVQLPDIHCSSCLILLERMSEWLEGVLDVRVDFSAKRATIQFNPETLSIAVLAAWLDYVGYPPSLISEKERKRQDFSKLGIAGFAMGNAMMSAFPEYFGLDSQGHVGLLTVFRWSTAVFATLSLVVAGISYLQNAFKAIRSRQWSLDIPIAVGMIALWSWSVYELLAGLSGGYFDSLSGFIFFLLLGKMLQERTYAAFSFERTVKDFLPLSVYCQRVEGFLKLDQLVPEDNITIQEGGIIPITVKVKKPISIDYSFLTGESVPVDLDVGQTAYQGGRVLHKPLLGEVLENIAEQSTSDLWKEEDYGTTGWVSASITAWFTRTVLILSFFGGLVWYFVAPDRAVEIAVSVLIIACPCALSLAAPFAYGTASALLSKRKLYLKSGRAVADLAAVQVAMWDKTGTLTQKGLDKSELSLTSEDAAAVLFIANTSIHPVAQSLVTSLSGIAFQRPQKFFEIREISGKGLEAKGRDSTVWRIGSGNWIGQPPGPTYIEKNGEILGAFTPEWTYRPLRSMFKSLDKMGVTNVLISGDQPRDIPKEWKQFFEDRLHFSCSPKEKRALVEQYKRGMYLGDGLNDVEAIDAALVGLAVVDNVLGYFPKGNGVIFSEALPNLPEFLRYAKRMKRWTKGAYLLSLFYNIAGIGFALTGQLSPVVAAILMPISSITVVLFSTAGAYLLAPKG